MATRLLRYIERATFATDDLSGAGKGGLLTTEQARTFLRDAIESTAVLSQADVFDSESPTFEIPKIDFAARIMRAGTEGQRLGDSDRAEPGTDKVELSTKLLKGEVPVTDETFEDNVERTGLANTLMQMIAEAVGRDLEEIALKWKDTDPDVTFGMKDGVIHQLVNSATANEVTMAGKTSHKAIFKTMVDSLPTRYRRAWDRLRLFVPVDISDGYADEISARGTALGDQKVQDRSPERYRGIEITEVTLLSGTQDSVDYSKFAILCDPKNLAVAFHRRVRIEKFRDPREGVTSFLPSVRMDVAWKQDSAVVLATNLPSL